MTKIRRFVLNDLGVLEFQILYKLSIRIDIIEDESIELCRSKRTIKVP